MKTITQSHIKAYLLYLQENEMSKATIEKYNRDLTKFCVFAKGQAIGKALCLEYKSYLKESYSINSANSMLAALNSFLKYFGNPDCCVKQFKVQRRVFCDESRELSPRDYKKLVSAAGRNGSGRLSLIIQTLCSTGIRVSELKYITAEAVYSGSATVSCKGKTRTVFIVSKLRKLILPYLKKQGIKSGCVFVTRNGKPLDRSNIWREMKKLCLTAGVNSAKVFPHNLRHLFARMFYELEKDIVKLADVLGHSSINTTRIYIISSGHEHRKKMECMQLVFPLTT